MTRDAQGRADCRRCRHSSDLHRLDDDTNKSPVDPAAKFRCLSCDCPDFVD
jgi:hypothetical protein